jgi:hypothetical protein
MGYCAEPTAEMGPFHVEVRTESFYLSRAGEQMWSGPHGPTPSIELLLVDIPAIRAALDQAEYVAEHGEEGESEYEYRVTCAHGVQFVSDDLDAVKDRGRRLSKFAGNPCEVTFHRRRVVPLRWEEFDALADA